MHDMGLAAKPLVLGPAVSYMPWQDIDNNMPGLVDVWHYTSSTHNTTSFRWDTVSWCIYQHAMNWTNEISSFKPFDQHI